MKKRYSTEDLAKIAKQTINIQYDNPQKILDDLRTNIKRKVKALHTKELTDNEILTHSLTVANDLFQDLNRITLEIISNKLSNEIIDKSLGEGIELSDYKDYFIQFAKEMVKQLLQAKFNQLKKQIRQAKSKKKR
tara:strand:+ start:1350 stop:1754 length:405 start_codon:yes stop_codon:yes gene_type:complete